MDLRAFVRHVSPPFLLTLLLKLYDRLGFIRRSHVWVGRYSHFGDVPSVGKGFSSDTWRQSAVGNTQRLMAFSRHPGSPSTGVTEGAVLLSAIAALVSRGNGGRLRVLDFGGGAGIGEGQLLCTVQECSVLEYHVVELEPACEDGSRLFEQDRRIHFHTSLPGDVEDIDILYVEGALQFVEDWAGLLGSLCACQARYVLLSHVPAGDFPPYATALNNMPGSLIPEWFLNVHEIIETMGQSGYTLIFRSTLQAVFHQDNFPEELRLPGGHFSAFVFARNS